MTNENSRTLSLPQQPLLLADSTNWTGSRLTTFLVPIPTVLLAEFRTHRLLKWGDDEDFSINANSDRAVPIEKKINQVEACPYIPIPTLAQAGMSGIEAVDDATASIMDQDTKEAIVETIARMRDLLARVPASKQYINRRLYPFSWTKIVVTGDDRAWKCFFNLRANKPDVEPNFRFIANILFDLYTKSTPERLEVGEWHLAFKKEAKEVISSLYNDGELEKEVEQDLMAKVSASMCARISFGIEKAETLDKHLDRFNKCNSSGHISVAEHQAMCPSPFALATSPAAQANVKGWFLFRKLLEGQA